MSPEEAKSGSGEVTNDQTLWRGAVIPATSVALLAVVAASFFRGKAGFWGALLAGFTVILFGPFVGFQSHQGVRSHGHYGLGDVFLLCQGDLDGGFLTNCHQNHLHRHHRSPQFWD